MTKFEHIGIENQLCSESKSEALRNFQTSCYICCYSGIRINCDKCRIKQVHTQVLACIDEYRRIERERGMRNAK